MSIIGPRPLLVSYLPWYTEEEKQRHVQIHTAVSDIERYFAMIDVLVLPSYREGFGNVVIEAAAVGTPAIVSNIPGPIDTIDAGNEQLFLGLIKGCF